ncbi:helix-turn-helix domain-containing protein [Mesorhizobium sp. 1M-11]|uniref:helix-turn-helix domain-containing protein n=1 Tax=Mesorhizobium sp. 1M-11 TaxID=1529006 RepID=UPI0006C77319|nr:helix-turn-helix domain-containing protein [Mesorhizobium sp. 1M-11]
MFIARYENTMRNARPKGVEPEPARPSPAPRTEDPAVAAYRCIDVLEPRTPAREIISRVGALHGYTLAEITGPRLEKRLVQARFDAIKAVADARPDMSLPQIGRIFNRDHTSILHALKKRGGRRPEQQGPGQQQGAAK